VREIIEAPDRLPRKPKVSILCPAYDQVDLIGRCVESLVAQVTSFDYEIVIRDDASTDGTREVLRDLQRQYPNKIRLILESTNHWPISPLNVLLPAVKGRYIALCEGDDFWTSSDKLQSCVDALDNDTEIKLVGHLAAFRELASREVLNVAGTPGRYGRGQLADCHANSFVIRTGVVSKRWFEIPPITHGDLKIRVIVAEAGEALVLDKVLSEYTIHSQGSWQSLDVLDKAQAKLRTYQVLQASTKNCRGALSSAAANHGRVYVYRVFRNGHWKEAVVLWFKWLRVVRSASSLLTLFVPPGTAGAASVFQRLSRGRST